jgi:hypothetical protein
VLEELEVGRIHPFFWVAAIPAAMILYEIARSVVDWRPYSCRSEYIYFGGLGILMLVILAAIVSFVARLFGN